MTTQDSEDARVWVGHVQAGAEERHRAFVQWLNGPEAHDIFRRRRLNSYALYQAAGGRLVVVFTAPRTGDPRLMIDFLRYPGVWPDFWQFERGGRLQDEPEPLPDASARLAYWNRSDEQARAGAAPSKS